MNAAITTTIDPTSGVLTIARGTDTPTGHQTRTPTHEFLTGADDLDNPYASNETKIRTPYSGSAFVFAAIRMIADPIGSAKLQLFRDSDHTDPLDDPNVNAFWSRPANSKVGPITLSQFIRHTVSLRQLYGTAYWLLDDTWLSPGSNPTNRSPLVLAGPNQMTDYWAGGELTGWTYRSSKGEVHHLLPEQVINCRLPNPHDIDDPRGIAPWESAAIYAETEKSAATAAKRLMDNNGDRGIYIVAKGGRPSPEQVAQIEASLREKRRLAARGIFKTTFLSADLEPHTPKLDATTADFAASRLGDRKAIFVAYKVPPSMADKFESNSIGSASDWYRLIVDTCEPEGNEVAQHIAHVTSLLTGQRSLIDDDRPSRRNAPDSQVHATFNFDDHPVMMKVRQERIDSGTKLHDRGIPWDTIDKTLKIGLGEFPGHDIGYLPANKFPVSTDPANQQDNDATDDNNATPTKTNPFDDLETLLHQHSQRQQTPPTPKPETRATPQAEDPRITHIEAQRSHHRKRLQRELTKHLYKARKETLANIAAADLSKSQGQRATHQTRALAIELIFDKQTWTDGLLKGIKRVLFAAIDDAGHSAVEEYLGTQDTDDSSDPDTIPGSDDSTTPDNVWNNADPELIKALRRRANVTKDLSNSIWDSILKDLEDGIQAGESNDKLAARLRASFNQLDKVRARTIARTETHIATETGRYIGFQQAGVLAKGWLSAGDGEERDSHRHADGQIVAMNDTFLVGQSRLKHPGDPQGPAEEIINCRCTMTAEPPSAINTSNQ